MAHRKHNQNEQSDERQNDARQRVEHAVAQALQAQIPHLHSEIVRQVLETVKALVAPGVTTMDLERAAEKKIRESAKSGVLKDLVASVRSMNWLASCGAQMTSVR